MRILATASVLLLLTGTGWAQRGATPPPTDLTKGTAMTAAELHATIARLGDERPNALARVFTLAGPNSPYAVNVEHRTNQPQAASLHDTEAEMFYVIDGGGTMVTEGTIVEETRNGPNLSGKGIEGGTPHKLGAGDFFMVPEGIAHWWSQIDPGGMNVMSIHFPRAR
jgi:mannose-6-phosphate isomerase-like protein (cupin superfamily)